MSKNKNHGAHEPARQQKRAHFQSAESGSSSKSRTAVLIAVIAVLSVAALYVIYSSRQSGGALGGQLKAASAPGQDVRIPIAEVNDGKAKFYNYTLSNNQEIRFFVIKSSDGVIRTAFNACDVCYEARRGYHQEGDDMVCNKCGQHFPSIRVNEVKGGCNPAPLERTVEGDHLVINANDLQRGAFYF
jgi:uncharacterized membrane protein